jgi:glycosyltransferase involved in cell wall biosynthesis
MNSISLIIPAFNEECYLPKLLDSVELARQIYQNEGRRIEIIVADNGSTDRTAEIARGRGCIVTYEKRRIIGAVRNRGATMARGEILAFTDADNQIHPSTFNAIHDALHNPTVIAGATGVQLERMSLGIAAAYAIILPMVWATGMDTGVVFCRNKDFRAIQGYNEERLFAEDVQLLWDFRQLGKARGQHLVRLRRYKATTSTRKFDYFGEWHYIWLILRFFASLAVPWYSLDRLARRYWYSDQR